MARYLEVAHSCKPFVNWSRCCFSSSWLLGLELSHDRTVPISHFPVLGRRTGTSYPTRQILQTFREGPPWCSLHAVSNTRTNSYLLTRFPQLEQSIDVDYYHDLNSKEPLIWFLLWGFGKQSIFWKLTTSFLRLFAKKPSTQQTVMSNHHFRFLVCVSASDLVFVARRMTKNSGFTPTSSVSGAFRIKNLRAPIRTNGFC